MFLIRARDKAGPAAVSAWANLHEFYGGDSNLADMAREHGEKMVRWQEKNGCKSADLPGTEIL